MLLRNVPLEDYHHIPFLNYSVGNILYKHRVSSVLIVVDKVSITHALYCGTWLNNLSLLISKLLSITASKQQTRLRLNLFIYRCNYYVLIDWFHYARVIVIIALVLNIVVATLTAFFKAFLVTFSGSITPILNMLPYLSFLTSYPQSFSNVSSITS